MDLYLEDERTRAAARRTRALPRKCDESRVAGLPEDDRRIGHARHELNVRHSRKAPADDGPADHRILGFSSRELAVDRAEPARVALGREVDAEGNAKYGQHAARDAQNALPEPGSSLWRHERSIASGTEGR